MSALGSLLPVSAGAVPIPTHIAGVHLHNSSTCCLRNLNHALHWQPHVYLRGFGVGREDMSVSTRHNQPTLGHIGAVLHCSGWALGAQQTRIHSVRLYMTQMTLDHPAQSARRPCSACPVHLPPLATHIKLNIELGLRAYLGTHGEPMCTWQCLSGLAGGTK
jgi:hypothetical protein